MMVCRAGYQSSGAGVGKDKGKRYESVRQKGNEHLFVAEGRRFAPGLGGGRRVNIDDSQVPTQSTCHTDRVRNRGAFGL